MNMDRIQLIKQAALKAKAKKLNTTVEELEFQEAVKNLDERKAAKKEELKLHKKLTKSVGKAGKDAPGSLECFKDENRYYSERETRDYIEASSYFESYQAMKEDWD